jgi:hypothetical protein
MKDIHSLAALKKKICLMMDNELEQCECNELRAKVEQDPKLKNIYDREKDFRVYLKTHISRPTPSIGLVQNIKNSIGRSE